MIEREIVDIKNAKALGIAGALSLLANPYISLAGIIILYIALKRFSEAFGEKRIANDFLLALVISFAVLLLALFATLVVPFLMAILVDTNFPYWLIIALPFLIIWIGLSLSAYFLKRSFYALSSASGEDYFRIAGDYILLGTILSIFLVGIIIFFMGQIYETLAFFSLPDSLAISKTSEGG
ncbi:DUF996 domain-containing protein [bacterium]|nr:DUF996 domain-containing protein [bacterium]